MRVSTGVVASDTMTCAMVFSASAEAISSFATSLASGRASGMAH
jgi:hypothetical protein